MTCFVQFRMSMRVYEKKQRPNPERHSPTPRHPCRPDYKSQQNRGNNPFETPEMRGLLGVYFCGEAGRLISVAAEIIHIPEKCEPFCSVPRANKSYCSANHDPVKEEQQ
jgi:hypothetical protein